jgi:molecular chaperone DnaJ
VPADHYAVLGVAPEADAAEIRAAYVRLMRLHHPDHRLGDAAAEEYARRLNAAYEVLGDPARRAAHDRRLRPKPRVADVAPVGSRPAAYSEERARYRRSFSAAALQVAALLLLIGTLLLAALPAS